MFGNKSAFTLLETLVVIAILGIVTVLSVSDFSFVKNVNRRPPLTNFLEAVKLARLEAIEGGEEVSLFYDAQNRDLVARKSFDGAELFRKNLYLPDANNLQKSLPKKDAKPVLKDSQADIELEAEAIRKQKERMAILESFPKIEIIFRPIYPEIYNYTTNDLNGLETLPCLRFSPDSSMSPSTVEFKVGSKTVAAFEFDVFSGYPLKDSKHTFQTLR